MAFHPLRPTLLSVSGSRHFEASEEEDVESEDDSDSDSGDGEGEEVADSTTSAARNVRRCQRRQPTTRDASVKLWDFGCEGLLDRGLDDG